MNFGSISREFMGGLRVSGLESHTHFDGISREFIKKSTAFIYYQTVPECTYAYNNMQLLGHGYKLV